MGDEVKYLFKISSNVLQFLYSSMNKCMYVIDIAELLVFLGPFYRFSTE